MLHLIVGIIIYFFFQAEDGIRDYKVTGVQTCALPISVNLDWTSSSRTKVVFDYLEEEGGALSDSDFDTTVSFDPIANHETISLTIDEDEGSSALTHNAHGQTTNKIEVRSRRYDGRVIVGTAP